MNYNEKKLTSDIYDALQDINERNRWEISHKNIDELAKKYFEEWERRFSSPIFADIFHDELRVNLGKDFTPTDDIVVKLSGNHANDMRSAVRSEFYESHIRSVFKGSYLSVLPEKIFPIDSMLSFNPNRNEDLDEWLGDVITGKQTVEPMRVYTRQNYSWRSGENENDIEIKNMFRNNQKYRKVIRELERELGFEFSDNFMQEITNYEQKMSVVTQRTKADRDVFLTIHPVDIIYMGDGTNGWNSCYHQEEGEYAGSPYGVLQSDNIMLAVTYKDNSHEFNGNSRPQLENRSMLYASDEGWFLEGSYPHDSIVTRGVVETFMENYYIDNVGPKMGNEIYLNSIEVFYEDANGTRPGFSTVDHTPQMRHEPENTWGINFGNEGADVYQINTYRTFGYASEEITGKFRCNDCGEVADIEDSEDNGWGDRYCYYCARNNC